MKIRHAWLQPRRYYEWVSGSFSYHGLRIVQFLCSPDGPSKLPSKVSLFPPLLRVWEILAGFIPVRKKNTTEETPMWASKSTTCNKTLHQIPLVCCCMKNTTVHFIISALQVKWVWLGSMVALNGKSCHVIHWVWEHFGERIENWCVTIIDDSRARDIYSNPPSHFYSFQLTRLLILGMMN